MNPSEYSDLFLERYLAGDLKADEKKAFDAALANEPALSERLRALQRSNDEILSRYPSAKMAAAIRQKAKREPSGSLPEIRPTKRRPVWLWITPALVLGIAAFIWFSPLRVNDDSASAISRVGSDLETPSGVRFKGEDQLYLYRKKAGSTEAEKLEPGQVVRSGEQIQLAYLSAGNPFGVIFSIDGRGNVTRHFLEKTNPAARLVSGKKTFLSESYELDDAPKFEVFFLITGNKKLDTDKVMTQAAALAKSPDTCESNSRTAFPKLRLTTFKILKQNP